MKSKSDLNLVKFLTVSDYERLITELLLKDFIRGKSTNELIEIFTELDMDKDQAVNAAKEISKVGVAGTTLVLLVKVLGKKAVKEIVILLVAKIIKKFLGKEVAEKIIEVILKDTAQKLFAKIVSGIGWALIAIDIIKLGSLATRITVPTIAFLVSVKTATYLKQGVQKHGAL